jgi:hypothetical protein
MTSNQDMNRNPDGRGGFADNPQNRSSGHWKKADTPRFKLERMMKLSEPELKAIADDIDAPYFERKLATAIKKADWKVIREMTDQVYGQPKQTIDTTIAMPQPLAPVRTTDLETD